LQTYLRILLDHVLLIPAPLQRQPVRGQLGQLIPGLQSQQRRKQRVGIPCIHGLAVLLDAILVSKDEGAPQAGVLLPEGVVDLAVQAVVKEDQLELTVDLADQLRG
jgi:hypothetical protein